MHLSYKTQIKLPELGLWETHFPEKILTSYGKQNGYVPKLHTLREDPHNRWKPGKAIHHATGVRTPSYNCFYHDKQGCKSVQQIQIINEEFKEIRIYRHLRDRYFTLYTNNPNHVKNLKQLPQYKFIEFDKNLHQFIQNDGFDTPEQFWAWFNQPIWHGKIIHWTDLMY